MTHVLTVDEMPSHSHSISAVNDSATVEDYPGNYPIRLYQDKKTNWTASTAIDTNGNSRPHNNMPPYYTTYIWHRTA